MRLIRYNLGDTLALWLVGWTLVEECGLGLWLGHCVLFLGMTLYSNSVSLYLRV